MIRSCFSKLPVAFFGKAAALAAVVVAAQAGQSFAQFNAWQAYETAAILVEGGTLTVSGTANKIEGNVGFGTTGGNGTFTTSSATGVIVGHTVTSNYTTGVNTAVAPVSFQASSGTSYTATGLSVTSEAAEGSQGAQATAPATGATAAVASQLSAAFTDINGIATTYAGASGTALAITSGGSLTLPAGNGPFIYNATVNSNFATGAYDGTFSINGTANQQVVIDIAATNPTLDGAIVVNGALKAQNVLINFTGASSTATIDTFGRTAYGLYVNDATSGKFAVTNSEIIGLLVGGSGSTFSGSTIWAAPEPGTFAIAILGILSLVLWQALQLRKGKLA